MSARRDYAQLLQRIEALQGPQYEHHILAEIAGYPIALVRRALRDDVPTAFLSGGTHGDEPAGVEAAMAFLQRDISPWLEHLSFEVLVCLNAHGYVHNARNNAQDVDVNWAWAREDVLEVQAVKEWVRDRRFEFVCDFHEDWESPGFYLYEMRRDAPVVSERIIAAVEQVCPLNLSDEIEGMKAVRGIVQADNERAERLRGKGIPIELYNGYTDHLLTLESPTERPLTTRVAAHMAALDVVVAAHLPPDS